MDRLLCAVWRVRCHVITFTRCVLQVILVAGGHRGQIALCRVAGQVSCYLLYTLLVLQVILAAGGHHGQTALCRVAGQVSCHHRYTVCFTGNSCGRWSSWTDCSVPCGGGLKYRSRSCVNFTVSDTASFYDEIGQRSCNKADCDEVS